MTFQQKLDALPIKPLEPEFLDDRWYYRGFTQYLKDEAFRAYKGDLAEFYRARLALARELLNDLLNHDFAEDCQECAIGKSQEWKDAKSLLAKLDSEL